MRTEKLSDTSLSKLKERMGYDFKNEKLLLQALSHSSYTNEVKMRKEESNERLEFLGDAVLELVTSDYVYHAHEDLSEGDLTKLRASIVCEQTLSSCARDLNIGEFLLLGRGEDLSGGRNRGSILSDALEAIIGAIYLDGGFANAKEFIREKILKNAEQRELFFDSKTILQEIIQNHDNKQKIRYKLISEEGPDHNKSFTMALFIGNEQISTGVGRTKKAAEQKAAMQAIKILRLNK
ncbi:MAG TPA: ribonuclease III [Clostridiales bacterium]|nr:ribonuclease III [Clostridiales bacterium]